MKKSGIMQSYRHLFLQVVIHLFLWYIENMTHPLLAENEAKRLNLPLPYLICFAMFAAWQMGVTYFSGQTLTLDGRTPIPINLDNVTIFIVLGYAASILVMIFKPEIIVWASRITTIIILIIVISFFLPLPPETMARILYFQFFCCLLLTGFETGIAVGLFTLRSALLWLSAGYGIGNIFVALLHNDFIKVEFSVFRLFSLVSLLLFLVFLFRLPGSVKAWPHSVKKTDGFVAPKRMFAGVFLWTIMGGLILMFGTSVAEGTKHGVFIFYLSFSITGLSIYPLWKFASYSPFRTFKFLPACGAIGFILAIVALFVTSLSLIAVVFLGIGGICCWIIPLFGVMLRIQYPSRYIAPVIILIAFAGVLIHASLLEAFRDQKLILHVVYLAVAVTLVIVYLLLEPYLSYSFNREQLPVNNENEERRKKKEEIYDNTEQSTSTPTLNPSPKPQVPSLHIDMLNYQETRIAELILSGYTYTEIAVVLKIKPNTVKWYQKELYSKLGINSKRELFALAAKRE